ncbi:hypothetical protein CFAM422_001665 [Trichoderma lentiforme]|uniref:Uncharacterized protein n=1 Tax=Trichoderma lentiforme TaxID=1567552 RepID=A0A9P5CI19_9HYPO|nr:hypothetical protein CFAM422_001665 [Trichoderma lentiforme]
MHRRTDGHVWGVEPECHLLMQNELPDSPASTIFVQAKTSTPQWSRPQTFLKAVPMQSRWSADNTSLVGLLSSPRQNDPSASPSSSRCPLWLLCALRHDYIREEHCSQWQDGRGKQALIVPDEHVFDPILTTIQPLYLACTRRLGKRSRPAIEYTRDSTPHARSPWSPFISYRGQDVVRGVRGRTAPALSVLRTCFLFRQGCRCSSLLRFDPLEVFASWPGNPQQISHADLIKPREPCNPSPSQPIDSQSLSLEIWSSQSSTSSWPSLALEESSPKQAERVLQVQSIGIFVSSVCSSRMLIRLACRVLKSTFG